jgi:hypothetical protein
VPKEPKGRKELKVQIQVLKVVQEPKGHKELKELKV